jgi:hypothetical protein
MAYTADTIDTPYAFYVADGLDDDVTPGDNAIKAANEHLASKFGMPELLTARAEAVRAFDAHAADKNDNTARDKDDARRVHRGMLASLRAHWDNSPEGRQSAMDVGI